MISNMLNTRTIFRNDTDRAGEISLRVFSRLPVGSLLRCCKMKLIPLTQGQFAIVDDEDYQWLSQWKWHARKHGNAYYAVRDVRQNEKRKLIRMHREILRPPQRKARGKSSKFKGVNWCKREQKWHVKICVNNKAMFLGYYKSEEEGAQIYDAAAIAYFRGFARTNF